MAQELEPKQGTAQSAEQLLQKERAELESINVAELVNLPETVTEKTDQEVAAAFLKEANEQVAEIEGVAEPVAENATNVAETATDDVEVAQEQLERAVSLEEANAEIVQLKSKLGKQGSERGELVSRVEAAEAKLQAFEQAQKPAPEPVSGRDIAKQLDPTLTDKDFEGDLGPFWERIGNMMKGVYLEAATAQKGELDQLRTELGSFKSKTMEETAAAAAGLAPEVRQELLEDNAWLANIEDPTERTNVMRKLAIADGKLATEPPPKPKAEPPRRDPATHVSGGSTSAGSVVSRPEALREALWERINAANNAEDLDQAGQILEAVERGDIDLGAADPLGVGAYRR